MKFGIIGTGIVGTALAVCLEKAGHECVGVNTRSRVSYERFRRYLSKEDLSLEQLVPEVDLLFITTQDSLIESVAASIAKLGLAREGQTWIHCSGSLSSEILRPAEGLPISCLSIHPLQAFASVDNALNILHGTHFGVEGENEQLGEQIVWDLGGIPHRLPRGSKSLYHAGAVVASNYLVTISALAVELFVCAGIDREEALESLLPLMQGTMHNLEKLGLPQALTGPIARGDAEVVKGHLQSMPAEITGVYRALGVHALKLGQARKELSGLEYPVEVLEELRSLLGD